jgi:choice-of-anchor B domain-containing protein
VTLLCNWNGADTANNGKAYNGVCGFVQNGKEYAAIGSRHGVYIIDVNTCIQVTYAPSSSMGAINREYKTYKNYLYAVADNVGPGAKLEIYDLQYLPDSMPLAYRSLNSECMNAHSLFIDSVNAKLYLGVNSSLDSVTFFPKIHDMSVFSLENPARPKLLCHFKYDKIHDMYVRNDTAYMSASNSGYIVADFSQDTAYTILGAMPSYDYQGYNHSSWVNSKGIGVMADETYGMPVKVINTRNINNIEVITTFSPRPGDSTCTPHNPYILNEDYALIAYYLDGLQIYNISKPDSPYRTGYYDTYPGANLQHFNGAWGCDPFLPSHRILVSDMATGLYVFNADTALNLHVQDTPVVPIPTVRNFVIFPNPAKDKVCFYVPEDGDGEVCLYDITGKCVLKQSFYADTASNQAIELPLPRNFPAGMYTLRVVMRENSYKGKFIKAQN